MYAIAEEVERIIFAFDKTDSRRDSVRDLAKRVDAAVKTARRAGKAEGLREANEKHARLLAAAKALLDEIEWQNDRPFTSRVKFERYRELDAAAALLARAEEVERE